MKQKAHNLLGVTQSLSSAHIHTHSHIQTQKEKQELFTSLAVAHLWTSTASFITHMFFCPLTMPIEQCFLNPVPIDLYLIALEVPPLMASLQISLVDNI